MTFFSVYTVIFCLVLKKCYFKMKRYILAFIYFHHRLCVRWRDTLNAFEMKPLSTNTAKWSNTLKQFFGNLPSNCLSVFDHFEGLALKGTLMQI